MTYPIPNDVLKPIVNATHLPNNVVSPTVAHAKISHMTPRAAPQHGITIAHVRLVTLPLTMSPRLLHNKPPPILRASKLIPHSHPNQALTLIVGHGILLPKIVICVLTRRLSSLVQHQHHRLPSHTPHILLISLPGSIKRILQKQRIPDSLSFPLGPSLNYPLPFRVTPASDTTTTHSIGGSTSTGTISADYNTPLTLISKLSKTFHSTERTRTNHMFFVGYEDRQQVGYRIYLPEQKHFIVNYHVTFLSLIHI